MKYTLVYCDGDGESNWAHLNYFDGFESMAQFMAELDLDTSDVYIFTVKPLGYSEYKELDDLLEQMDEEKEEAQRLREVKSEMELYQRLKVKYEGS